MIRSPIQPNRLLVAEQDFLALPKSLPELMEGEPEITLSVGLIGGRPQQSLDGSRRYSYLACKRGAPGAASRLARDLHPAVGMPQAKPPQECDLQP